MFTLNEKHNSAFCFNSSTKEAVDFWNGLLNTAVFCMCTWHGKLLTHVPCHACLASEGYSEHVFRVNECEGAFERGLCDREGNWHCADPHYPAINTLNDPQDDSKEILDTAWPLCACVCFQKNKTFSGRYSYSLKVGVLTQGFKLLHGLLFIISVHDLF